MSWTILTILIVIATLALAFGLSEWLVKRHRSKRDETAFR